MFKVGQTVKVLGYRGISRPTEFAVVEAVRNIHDKPLKWYTYIRNRITRSPLLVTLRYEPDADEDGPVYRSYYTEFLMAKRVTAVSTRSIFRKLRSWWNS